jgi:hypothetical protein
VFHLIITSAKISAISSNGNSILFETSMLSQKFDISEQTNLGTQIEVL